MVELSLESLLTLLSVLASLLSKELVCQRTPSLRVLPLE